MKIIIAGSRTFNNYERLKFELDQYIKFKCDDKEIIIISGGARGADKLGEKYAIEKGYKIELYNANWDIHGKKAGYLRNGEMAKAGNVLFAFWDKKSKGTKHMIDLAEKEGLEINVINIKGKIWLSNINNIKTLPNDCIKLLVARQPIKDMEKYNLRHIIKLAPSHQLLRDIKDNKITWKEYVVRYRQEMVQNNIQQLLNKIENYLLDGKDIALICYCKNFNQCHRGILANYFKEIGFEIIWDKMIEGED